MLSDTKRYRIIKAPEPDNNFDMDGDTNMDNQEYEEYDERDHIAGDTHDYVYEELTSDMQDKYKQKNYMINHNIAENENDPASYWRSKLLELMARQKSKVYQFANMLSNLIQQPINKVLSDFPKDFIAPNVQIKQVLQNLLNNLHQNTTPKEWYQKQIIIRSILASIEEYRNEFIDKNDIAQMVQDPNSSDSDSDDDDMIPKAILADTHELNVKLKNTIEYFNKNKVLSPNSALNDGDRKKLSQTTAPTCERIISDMSEFFKKKEVGLSMSSKILEDLSDFFNSSCEQIKKYADFVKLDTTQYDVFVDTCQEYIEKLTNKQEDKKIPVHYLKDVINIFKKLLTIFEEIKSGYRKISERNKKPTRVKLQLEELISSITTQFKSKYTDIRVDSIYDKYNYLLASNNFKLYKNDKNKSDISELISWLNEIDGRGQLKKSFITPWATEKNSSAVIFFQDSVYGFLLVAQNDINRFGNNDFTLMELITSEDSAALFAKYVSYLYQNSQMNERKVDMKSTNSMIYGATKYQIMDGKSLTKSIVIYFKQIQRAIVKDESSGKVLGTKLILIKNRNTAADNRTVLGIREIESNRIKQTQSIIAQAEDPNDPLWG
jgi:hypothetical protein